MVNEDATPAGMNIALPDHGAVEYIGGIMRSVEDKASSPPMPRIDPSIPAPVKPPSAEALVADGFVLEGAAARDNGKALAGLHQRAARRVGSIMFVITDHPTDNTLKALYTKRRG